MNPILILSDDFEVTKVLEKFLSGHRYNFQVSSLSFTLGASSEIIQEISKYGVLLIGITRSKSPSWNFLEQISGNKEEVHIPIIALVSLSPEVVGSNYELWIQYADMFADYTTMPLVVNDLKAKLDDLLTFGAN